MDDKVHQTEEHAGYYYSEDRECAKKYGLDEDKLYYQYFVIFNGVNTVPYTYELESEGIDRDDFSSVFDSRCAIGSPDGLSIRAMIGM